MFTDTPTRPNPYRGFLPRKAIGGASAILGVSWLWSVLTPTIRQLFTREQQTTDYLFFWIIVPLMAIPGALAVAFGIELFRKKSTTALKWVVGLSAAFGTLWIDTRLSLLFADSVPEKIQSSLFMLLGTVVALPAYLIVVRALFPIIEAERPRVVDLIGKGVLALVAWQLWFLMNALFERYAPIQAGYTHVREEPWGILGFLLPIIVAYGFYRLAFSFLQRLKEGTRLASSGNALSK